MCSHSEGFSESIVQAMSLGKPIITTKNPSFEEALSGGCGMLVNNNAIDYSNGLKNILTDKKLRDEYSYKSVEKSYKYNECQQDIYFYLSKRPLKYVLFYVFIL